MDPVQKRFRRLGLSDLEKRLSVHLDQEQELPRRLCLSMFMGPV